MYFLDAQRDKNGADIYRTKTGFRYPLSRDRSGQYKVKSGEMIRVCMTSDFFLEEADPWRDEAWEMMYLDSENWLKASVEYENEAFQHLGSVVTNHGWSDWASTEIPADVKVMWYRLSRREDDYRIECSRDGKHFSQMRVCHMWEGAGRIHFGIYACSPEDSSFKAVFSDMRITECAWKAHDGQQPDYS